MRFALSLFIVNLVFSLVCARDCFFPAGNLAEGHSPCNSTLEVSTCCNSGETCLSNGLCLQMGLLARGGCTDKSWGTQCSPYCRDAFNGGGSPLVPCGDWKFTCGTDGRDSGELCVDNNFTIAEYHVVLRDYELQSAMKAADISQPASVTGELTAGAATITTTTTVMQLPTANNASPEAIADGQRDGRCTSGSRPQNSTPLIATVVGGILPVLSALIVSLVLLWREKKKTQKAIAENSSRLEVSRDLSYQEDPAMKRYAEADGSKPAHQLHAPQRHEMGQDD